MLDVLDRAVGARRESRRIALRSSFDPGSEHEWCALIRDLVAMANSGGGVIVFGVDRQGRPVDRELSEAATALNPARIADTLRRYADTDFLDVELVSAAKEGRPLLALVVGEAVSPIVFTKECVPRSADGRVGPMVQPGVIYFRHGAKSRPGTTRDLAKAIDRRVSEVRESWLSAVTRIVRSPVGAAPPAASLSTLPSEIRDSSSPEATPIRIVDDPRAAAYRVVDYDRTHPYRQKELLEELRRRRPELTVNQFDMLAIRHVYDIDAKVEFSHKGIYGTRQYSPKFLEWLVEQAEASPEFFMQARRQYQGRE
ncbi:MAG TPA: ATP-binding protein [Thermoanaerobaculia bacterium]|nr:ATP-binding protein [Thermoanaerobaculia bacterium]